MSDHSTGNLGYLQWAHAAYGLALARSGDIEQGEALAGQARTDLLAGTSCHTRKLGEIDLHLAEILELRGAAEESAPLREEALDVFRRIHGADHPRIRLGADPDAG